MLKQQQLLILPQKGGDNMYTGLEYYWKQRLSQGKYVLSEIKAKLQKAYYVDEALTEEQYNELLNYAETHVDTSYQPNTTLASLQEENNALTAVVDDLTATIISMSIEE